MVTISLQPFAFRKIVFLIAALVWLTTAVVFADPVFMNAHGNRIARRSSHSQSSHSGAKLPAERDAGAQLAIWHADIAPPAEAPPFSVSLERADTWNLVTTVPSRGPEPIQVTFWPTPLAR